MTIEFEAILAVGPMGSDFAQLKGVVFSGRGDRLERLRFTSKDNSWKALTICRYDSMRIDELTEC